ncbi:MAG: thioredoxin [Alphaproteobacteria bacterium]|nr:thioredoxin [Alphaproteobacteria bacterium]
MFFNKGRKEGETNQDGKVTVIFDVTSEEFEARVLAASMEIPVIVDFWAPWCGPCKALGPLLEKLVQESGGKVLMAKVNVDENQDLAAALRIQSIPTVYGFFQGRPVDAFQGILPEGQLRAFIDRLIKAAGDAQPGALDIPAVLKEAAQALSEKDAALAQTLYGQILMQDEKNVAAYAGLVRTHIAASQIDHARQLVERAPPEIAKSPAFPEVRTALELAQSKPAGALEDLMEKVDKNPDDHQARCDLALAQFAAGQREEAVESLLEIMRRNRGWKEEEARKQLLKIFEAMGSADPLTIESRRKLSAVLFS